jgi:thiol-disulfide isomerase/thioredoxin
MTKLLLSVTLAFAPLSIAGSIATLWDGKINLSGVEIPFKLEVTRDGNAVKGAFVNGDDRETSTSGTFDDGKLVLRFDDYATTLTATVKNGILEGEWGPYQKKLHPFSAKPFVAPAPSTTPAPSIDGIWEVQGVASAKGESTWRLIVRQRGAEATATILRVDGDTGSVAGRYQDGKFVLSHFSGARPSMLVLKPAGSALNVELIGLRGAKEYKALRPADARAQNLPAPADPTLHTSVRDASQPFPFSFPNLNGKLVSNTDPRFRNKVVLINITGSWCPNCHDEAPFLAELDRKYRAQGLEIVALSFEEAEQLLNPTRLRAFIKKYSLDYTVLLAGETGEAKDKLTQAVNWNAWPTTFFLGRDGLVRNVQAGFPSTASGALHVDAKQEFTAIVERLLAENKTSSRD